MRLKMNISVSDLWVIYTVILLSGFMACGNSDSRSRATGKTGNDPVPAKREFRMADIPEIMTSPQDRARYLVMHYWDRFDFTDTVLIHMPEISEQAFANYLNILPHAGYDTICFSIKNMLDKARTDKTGKMYPYFLELYKKYLNDPNSPMRNEEYYIPVVEQILNDPSGNEADKERAKFDLSLMMKNRAGHKASDFSYISVDGRKGSLYGLKKDYTILYFYNPDCLSCRQTTGLMVNSAWLNHLLETGKLDILAIYPDNELPLWKKHKDEIPSLWINAHDQPRVIKDKLLYDLKAIPTFYLLDRDKKVLLKDTDIQRIEAFLGKHENES